MIGRTEWRSVCLRLRAPKMRSERFCLLNFLIFLFRSFLRLRFTNSFRTKLSVPPRSYTQSVAMMLICRFTAFSVLLRLEFDIWRPKFLQTVCRSCIYFILCNRFECLDQKTIVSRYFSFLPISVAVSVFRREKNSFSLYCTRSGLTVAQHLHHMTGSGTVWVQHWTQKFARKTRNNKICYFSHRTPIGCQSH